MAMVCPECNHSNIDGVIYCEKCGHEFGSDSERLVTGNFSRTDSDLETAVEVVPEVEKPLESEEEVLPKVAAALESVNSGVVIAKARLVPKSKTFPVEEILLERRLVSLGKFDPIPVDIDLEDLLGAEKAEKISRQHAELYFENGVWNVKDLDSTNGVFIRRVNELRFSKLTAPEVLHSGDEVAFANIQFVFETL
jgi:FHA domain